MDNNSMLREMLSLLAKFQGKPFVLKLSGKIFAGPNSEVFASPSFKAIVEDAVHFLFSGIPIVVVLGAQPQIDKKMAEAKIDTPKNGGVRVTPPEAIEHLQSVYAETRSLVADFLSVSGQEYKPNIIWPDNAVIAKSISEEMKRTGEVESVNERGFNFSHAIFPNAPNLHFVSSLAKAQDGKLYNINADAVATAIAVGLQAEKLIFVSDGPVINKNTNVPFSRLSAEQAGSLIANGTATEGMVTKLDQAILALRGGVKSVHIVGHEQFLLDTFFVEGGTILEG